MTVRRQQGKLAGQLHQGGLLQFRNTSLLMMSHQQQLLSKPSASTHQQQPIQAVKPVSVGVPKML